MPAAKGLRVPVARRSAAEYLALFDGFRVEAEDVHPSAKVLEEKRGTGKLPWALIFELAALSPLGGGGGLSEPEPEPDS